MASVKNICMHVIWVTVEKFNVNENDELLHQKSISTELTVQQANHRHLSGDQQCIFLLLPSLLPLLQLQTQGHQYSQHWKQTNQPSLLASLLAFWEQIKETKHLLERQQPNQRPACESCWCSSWRQDSQPTSYKNFQVGIRRHWLRLVIFKQWLLMI